MSSDEGLSLVIVAFIYAFGLAFAIGANDVANAIGPAVGGKVLSLRQAVVLAAIFEMLGAFLLGGKVATTIKKKVIAEDAFLGDDYVFMLGMFAAIVASMLWVLMATFLKMPVSGTHATIGSVVGWVLVAKGFSAINWIQIGMIAISWIASPVLAGLTSGSIFLLLKFFILRRSNSYELTLLLTPIFYGLCLSINIFFILFGGVEALGWTDPPTWQAVTIALLVGLASFPIVWFWLLPLTRQYVGQKFGDLPIPDNQTLWQKYLGATCDHTTRRCTCNEPDRSTDDERDDIFGKFDDDKDDDNHTSDQSDSSPLQHDMTSELHMKIKNTNTREDLEGDGLVETSFLNDDLSEVDFQVEKFPRRTEEAFNSLQILTSAFAAFAHGSNDVSNAIAPYSSIWSVYEFGTSNTPSIQWWILLMGGVGIVCGLVVLGSWVIETVGQKLAKITPSRGVAIQFGAAFSVSVASLIGIPVSTTQAQVGSVMAVGWTEGRNAVNFRLFLSIAASWIITLPVSAGISAAVFASLQAISGWGV